MPEHPERAVIFIEVSQGPTLRTAMDALDLLVTTIPLIPEWHRAEREELESRMSALADVIEQQLKQPQ